MTAFENYETKPSFILDKVTTERLKFRKVVLKDAEEWMQFINSHDALEFLPFKTGSRKASEEWIQRQLLRYDENQSGLCALIEKHTGRMVGQCGLLVQEVDGKTELEIGYHLIPEFWKKGYATEAAQAAKDFAFSKNLSESLISIIHINNLNSQKVAERNGMKREVQTDFRGFPVFIYRVYKKDWQKVFPAKV